MTTATQTNGPERIAAQPDATNGNGKRKPGAPRENRNALRHGLRGVGFPEGCRKLESGINQFRRTVEDCVISVRGEITLLDALAINTAAKWERHGALAARWLRIHSSEMEHSERLSYSREVARAASERDKAIANLKLDVDRNGFDSIFNATLPAVPDDSAAPATADDAKTADASDATAGHLDGHGGDAADAAGAHAGDGSASDTASNQRPATDTTDQANESTTTANTTGQQ